MVFLNCVLYPPNQVVMTKKIAEAFKIDLFQGLLHSWWSGKILKKIDRCPRDTLVYFNVL